MIGSVNLAWNVPAPHTGLWTGPRCLVPVPTVLADVLHVAAQPSGF